MKLAQSYVAALTAGSLFSLHGCGGGDGGATEPVEPTSKPDLTTEPVEPTSKPDLTTEPVEPTSKPDLTTEPVEPTTTVPRSPSQDTPPLSGDEAVAYLNSQYMGYQKSDATSPVGVVMRTADSWGFFCDGFEGYQGCFDGHARCITSASVLNNHVMLHNDDQLYMGLKRSVGIMFNTSVVETKLGRCTYQYDGGSWGRYNRGCGSTARNGKGMCENRTSAWWNIDPKTGEACTDQSDAVLSDYCPTRQQTSNPPPPTSKQDPPCFWKGPAFYPEGGLIESETHKMLKQRIKNQGTFVDSVETWDEVVLDAEILLTELRRDPAVVIPAIVYELGNDERRSVEAKKTARKMADAMQAEFQMREPIPVVGVDTRIHLSAQDVPGPFFFGETWTTQTTTTTPRTQTACCDASCDGQVKEGWCSESEAHCKECSGQWCPPPVATRNGSIVV